MFNWIKNNSGSIIAVAVIGIFIYLDFYRCPVALILHFPCPTCGVTRALIALFRLDLSAYVEYNIMALPLLAALGLVVLRNCFKHKKAVNTIVYSILALNFLYYAMRVVFGFKW